VTKVKFTVNINNDSVFEKNERFRLTIINDDLLLSGVTYGKHKEAVVIIVNDGGSGK